MTRAQLTTMLLAGYGVLALVIAIWSHRRTHHPRDYFVGDRRGGGLSIGLSQAFNILPPWTMLVTSGSAFLWGYSALWFGVAFWLAGLVHAVYIAPRARALAASQHSVSLIHLLSFDAGERMAPSIVRFATLLLTLATLAIIVIQVHLIADIARLTLAANLGVVPVAIILLIVATAGWWALVLLESIHAMALLFVCLLVPLVALAGLEGWAGFTAALSSLPDTFSQWDAGRQNIVAIAFVAGLLSFLWIPLGQPALINRAVSARDDRAQRVSGILLVLWLTFALGGLLLIGWLGRALYDGLENPHLVLFDIPSRLLHPAIPAIFGIVFIGALTTNIAAQVAVLKTAFVSDLRPGRPLPANEWSRAVAVIFVIAITVVAYFVPPLTLDDLLFCWTALAAAFAPLLFVRLSGKRVRRGSILGAMSAGFMLVCVFHVMPDAPGDFLERVLPFVAALGIALSGGERRRNPDRADRTDETVHDRLPI